jgi:hypothetical protein
METICLGVCPNVDVTVQADGRVSVARHRWNRAVIVERFRVSKEEASQFRNILHPYRPVSIDPDACRQDVTQDAAWTLAVPEIEVKWCDAARPARLAYFLTRDSREAIRQALWSVHLYADGSRRD